MTSAQQNADGEAAFKTRWDSSYVKPSERFSYFRECICQAFFAYSPLPPEDGRLSAVVEKATLDKGLLSKVDTTPHRVIRTRADFAAIPDDLFSLGLTQNGRISGKTSGATFCQEKNQLCLVGVDAIESFEIVDGDRYEVIAMIFPKSRLRDVRCDHRYLVLNQRVDAALVSCLKLAGEHFETGSRMHLNCLMDASISLLNARFVNDPGFFDEVACAKLTSEGIFLVIKEYVARHLGNALLTTNHVAAHFDISARYVQKLFAAEETTFKSFVTERRLERVARDLVEPASSADVAEVAFRWGFSDLTTFHRNFKRRFNDTPQQLRRRVRQARKKGR